jgi:hypothetical protein
LGAEFGNEFLFIKKKEPGDEPKRAHGDIILSLGLNTSYRRENILKVDIHVCNIPSPQDIGVPERYYGL